MQNLISRVKIEYFYYFLKFLAEIESTLQAILIAQSWDPC